MSGPQHIAWHETAMRETAQQNLMDLQVLCAPNAQDSLDRTREALLAMAEGRE